jgi:hypothetical protein
MLTHAQLDALNFRLSPLGYGRLSNAFNCFFDRMHVDRHDNDNAKSLFDEFCTIKKPGQKCRLYLGLGRNDDLSKVTNCASFFRIIGIPYIGNINYSGNVSWWNLNCIPNRLRMFAFKFYNNILGLNQRTVHFAINPVRHCQFCFAQGLANPPDESFVHLFSTCPTVTNWHNEFIHKHFNGINLDGQDRIKFWFLGILPLHEKPSFAVLSAILVFQFCIWEEKLRKRTPAFVH